MNDLSVFCTSQFVIDKRVWKAYLSGLSVQQTINHILTSTTVNRDLIAGVVITQYRNFEMLEAFLHHPKQVSTQLIFSLHDITKQMLITTYYQLDHRVLRELLGKKLTHRIRKELEQVAIKTRTSILGCKRNFDNLKRISKKIEDFEGNDLISVIMGHFLLPRELAAQYCHVIFINSYRLDTTKRKLSQVTCKDYEYIASVIIQHLSSPTYNPLDQLDASVAEDCRSLKTVFFNYKDTIEKYRNGVIEYLINNQHVVLAEKCTLNSFKVILRNILQIGSSIVNAKEFRDIFLYLMERIVEPGISFNWTALEMEQIFMALMITFDSGMSVSSNVIGKYSKSMNRIVTMIQLSAVRLYPFCISSFGFGF